MKDIAILFVTATTLALSACSTTHSISEETVSLSPEQAQEALHFQPDLVGLFLFIARNGQTEPIAKRSRIHRAA
ncbi:MAG: hypothetical protein LBK01_07270 [Burkholderiaceae bacterium]|jgi:hypothetical protein|nr:hypothetical protein [Burkholderiaceae bacterium]